MGTGLAVGGAAVAVAVGVGWGVLDGDADGDAAAGAVGVGLAEAMASAMDAIGDGGWLPQAATSTMTIRNAATVARKTQSLPNPPR